MMYLAGAGLPRSLLKFSGGFVDDYATFSASLPTRPSCSQPRSGVKLAPRYLGPDAHAWRSNSSSSCISNGLIITLYTPRSSAPLVTSGVP